MLVSVFDDRSGWSVDDALIDASVAPLGLGDTRRELQPIIIANATAYGNFLPVAGSPPYVGQVAIRRPGHDGPVRRQFNCSHPRQRIAAWP